MTIFGDKQKQMLGRLYLLWTWAGTLGMEWIGGCQPLRAVSWYSKAYFKEMLLTCAWNGALKHNIQGLNGNPLRKMKIIIWFENVEVIGVLLLQGSKWKGNQIRVGWKLNWKWEHSHCSKTFKKLQWRKRWQNLRVVGMGDTGFRESFVSASMVMKHIKHTL